MLDNLSTVHESMIERKIGRLSNLTEVNAALRVALGL